jgi:hypothetical protein
MICKESWSHMDRGQSGRPRQAQGNIQEDCGSAERASVGFGLMLSLT